MRWALKYNKIKVKVGISIKLEILCTNGFKKGFQFGMKSL